MAKTREDKLQAIVRLIGPDSLASTDQLVLKVSEMIKNGFLQQNAFDDIDMYCSSEKQIMIIQLIMDFYKRALALIKSGCPLVKINAMTSEEEIVRIKMVVPNDKLEQISEIRSRMNTQFAELESVYSKTASL